MTLFEIPSGELCGVCHRRPATEIWAPEGPTLAFIRRAFDYRCRVCVVESHLRYCLDAAERIVGLQAELNRLKRGENGWGKTSG